MIERDAFYVGQTRPAKMEIAEGRIPFAISVQAFALCLGLSVVPALFLMRFEIALLYVPLHFGAWWVERDDPRAFRMLQQRLRLWVTCRVRGNWRVMGLAARVGRWS